MTDIRAFIQSHLLEPLKLYPTVIQDTMIEIITQRLQYLYEYAVRFPEILSPNQSRLDILQAIADQFLFTIRSEADLQEQINILDNILYVYSKRGSIDTIENMWKYYGGDLPKDVKVKIPAYNLFRYSMSKLSGTHVFQDNELNRSGVYEIELVNNTYPIPELRDFLLRELVAAGNLIYFSNTLHIDIRGDHPSTNPYKYLIEEDTVKYIQMEAMRQVKGLSWDGYNSLSPNPIFSTEEIAKMIDAGFSTGDIEHMQKHRNPSESLWSGEGSIFLELTNILDLYDPALIENEDDLYRVTLDTFKFYDDLGINITLYSIIGEIDYSEIDLGEGRKQVSSITKVIYKDWKINTLTESAIESFLYCTPLDRSLSMSRHLYDRDNNLIDSEYPGYFILGSTLLRKEVV